MTISDAPETPLVPLLFTPEQAAHLLGIGRTRLYQLLATGQLPSVKLGSSRRVTREALERYVAMLAGNGRQGVTAGRQDGAEATSTRRPARRPRAPIGATPLPFDS